MSRINDYVPIEVGDRHRLSPSSMAQFFDNSETYYNRSIGKTETFSGNTYTVIGTVVHAAMELWAKAELPMTDSDVQNYLDEFYSSNPDVDHEFVKKHWYDMYSVAFIKMQDAPNLVEYQSLYLVDDEVAVGGTVDYRKGHILGDYKTCKSIPKTIGDYKWQLMLYAWCDKMSGTHETTHLEICYIQRPDEGHISEKTGKLIGVKKADASTVLYTIQPQDWIDIEKYIKVELDCYKLVKANPQLARLIYRHNPLSFRQ